jgi:hypothetical protein
MTAIENKKDITAISSSLVDISFIRKMAGSGEMVNVNKMLEKTGKSKLFKSWYTNVSSKEQIQTVSRKTGIKESELVITIMKGPNENRGTWVHPRVAVYIALWADTDFGFDMTTLLFRVMSGDLSLIQDIVDVHDSVNDTVTDIIVIGGDTKNSSSMIANSQPINNIDQGKRDYLHAMFAEEISKIDKDKVLPFNDSVDVTDNPVIDRETIYKNPLQWISMSSRITGDNYDTMLKGVAYNLVSTSYKNNNLRDDIYKLKCFNKETEIDNNNNKSIIEKLHLKINDLSNRWDKSNKESALKKEVSSLKSILKIILGFLRYSNTYTKNRAFFESPVLYSNLMNNCSLYSSYGDDDEDDDSDEAENIKEYIKKLIKPVPANIVSAVISFMNQNRALPIRYGCFTDGIINIYYGDSGFAPYTVPTGENQKGKEILVYLTISPLVNPDRHHLVNCGHIIADNNNEALSILNNIFVNELSGYNHEIGETSYKCSGLKYFIKKIPITDNIIPFIYNIISN